MDWWWFWGGEKKTRKKYSENEQLMILIMMMGIMTVIKPLMILLRMISCLVTAMCNLVQGWGKPQYTGHLTLSCIAKNPLDEGYRWNLGEHHKIKESAGARLSSYHRESVQVKSRSGGTKEMKRGEGGNNERGGNGERKKEWTKRRNKRKRQWHHYTLSHAVHLNRALRNTHLRYSCKEQTFFPIC